MPYKPKEKTVYVPYKLSHDDVGAIEGLMKIARMKSVHLSQDFIRKLQDPANARHEDVIEYRKQMRDQTIGIGEDIIITYSEEEGHPNNRRVRHLSASSRNSLRAPNAQTLWTIAEKFGFKGSFYDCVVYFEKLPEGGRAVNFQQVMA